jgi:hypothetical protein
MERVCVFYCPVLRCDLLLGLDEMKKKAYAFWLESGNGTTEEENRHGWDAGRHSWKAKS